MAYILFKKWTTNINLLYLPEFNTKTQKIMKITRLRTFNFIFLFMTVAFLSGCSIEADNVLTDADKLKKELEEIIDKKDISRASVYLLRTHSQGDVYYYRRHEEERFQLEEQFIEVDDYYYNLEKLAKYEIRGYGSSGYINLYFDIY